MAAFHTWISKWEDPLVELVVIMEATGVYYEHLAWTMHQQGRKVHVVLANRAKKYFQSLGHKSKNDRLDVKALAHMGAERNLAPWQPLSRQLYLLRKLTREHEQIQQVRCEAANRLEVGASLSGVSEADKNKVAPQGRATQDEHPAPVGQELSFR